MRWYVYVYYDEDHQPFYCRQGLRISCLESTTKRCNPSKKIE